jgi:FAD/FMN-containing dehydrogenase
MIVDPRSLIAEVAADLTVERFEVGCLSKGLTPGPLSDADPQGSLSAAILRRAGRRSPRYGELWDRVLALEAELPGGHVVTTKGAPRAATGPDVTRTILEARGRLGRVRKLWVRLRPAPRERVHLSAEVGFAEGLRALAALWRAGMRPAEVRLEGRLSAARLAILLEGDPALVVAEVALARRALGALGVTPVEGAAAPAAPPAADEAPPLLVEAPWSSLPARVAEELTRLGDGGPARLAWQSHEAAGVAIPWPRGIEPLQARRALAEALLASVAEALERRCQ